MRQLSDSSDLLGRAFFSAGKRLAAIALCSFMLAACSDGGSGGAPAPPPPDPPPPPPAPMVSEVEASRFLSQATFGPNEAEIDALEASNLSSWFEAELAKAPTLHLDGVLAQLPGGVSVDSNGDPLPGVGFLPSHSFWKAAIEGDDQLRQRMAFALSQILVVSATDFNLFRYPQTLAAYMDILTEGAFGNYRDLLENVTYSVAMAEYLTYLRNARGDMATGRVPDENYAREIMQLFTIGLIQLNADGTPFIDGMGETVETYNNDDVTGLAKVFTGLSLAGGSFFANPATAPQEAFYSPLEIYEFFHSPLEKSFLGTTIPANTDAATSIDLALDAIFDHPNVAPFISRQLIQRFVTSDPDPAYVARVATAFENGVYSLPNGTAVGDGRRGDLAATVAAILFDDEARSEAPPDDPEFGKVREPVLRFTHWARAFKVNSADASNEVALLDTSSPALLSQHPYRSPSVFNFYRPGYIAPGTATGAAGLTAPELQLVNASSIVGYANFTTSYGFGDTPKRDPNGPIAFQPDYSTELALAEDPAALVDHLDLLLTYGAMQEETKTRIIDALNEIPASEAGTRVALAVVMAMTAPDYIVLR